jgi:hypothetical protein
MMTLVKWNYTKEEWKFFRKWKSRKGGMFFNLFSWLRSLYQREVPEIRIASDRVWFNDMHEPFQNSHRLFMGTNIIEGEQINILEISYEFGSRLQGIKIPIPKGKLKEAFEVQERLVIDGSSIG